MVADVTEFVSNRCLLFILFVSSLDPDLLVLFDGNLPPLSMLVNNKPLLEYFLLLYRFFPILLITG